MKHGQFLSSAKTFNVLWHLIVRRRWRHPLQSSGLVLFLLQSHRACFWCPRACFLLSLQSWGHPAQPLHKPKFSRLGTAHVRGGRGREKWNSFSDSQAILACSADSCNLKEAAKPSQPTQEKKTAIHMLQHLWQYTVLLTNNSFSIMDSFY